MKSFVFTRLKLFNARLDVQNVAMELGFPQTKNINAPICFRAKCQQRDKRLFLTCQGLIVTIETDTDSSFHTLFFQNLKWNPNRTNCNSVN